MVVVVMGVVGALRWVCRRAGVICRAHATHKARHCAPVLSPAHPFSRLRSSRWLAVSLSISCLQAGGAGRSRQGGTGGRGGDHLPLHDDRMATQAARPMRAWASGGVQFVGDQQRPSART